MYNYTVTRCVRGRVFVRCDFSPLFTVHSIDKMFSLSQNVLDFESVCHHRSSYLKTSQS